MEILMKFSEKARAAARNGVKRIKLIAENLLINSIRIIDFNRSLGSAKRKQLCSLKLKWFGICLIIRNKLSVTILFILHTMQGKLINLPRNLRSKHERII